MKIQKIAAAQQNVSRWSGGTTTQLAIFPREAVYAERDFLWRLSSAVVELPESDFTPLPDYDRILMILDGELSLLHDGGAEYVLRALEQTAFDGASHTFSRGQVTDFNLMMRKGCCTGCVEAKVLRGEAVWTDPFAVLPDADTQLLYCCGGEAQVVCGGETYTLEKGDALLVEGCAASLNCKICGESVVICAQMKLL